MITYQEKLSKHRKYRKLCYIWKDNAGMTKISQKVDRLSNSIVNRLSGDSFDTDIIELQTAELKNLKKGWKFDWTIEFKEAKVYKLVIRSSPDVIQGLISIEEQEGFIFMRLVETASHNYGSNKVYEGVLGNLVAFACKVSFDKGFSGYVVFEAKSKLVNHYTKILKAKSISGTRMYIDKNAAIFLVDTYFKDQNYGIH